MRTDKQIEASRLNGAKSRGPRSAEGKTRSSRNALKSGLYAAALVTTPEDVQAFEQLQAEYTARFQPFDPEERICLDMLIRAEWAWRRFVAAETRIWDIELTKEFKYGDNTLGGAFQRSQNSILRANRMIDGSRRSILVLIDRLKALQAARQAVEDADPVDPDPDSQPEPL